MSFFGTELVLHKNLTLSRRVIASPMQGVMTHNFSLAANRLGLIREWITPFYSVTADSLPSRAPLRKWIGRFDNGYPLTIQLIGHDRKTLTGAAQRFVELGAAGINLNFACPSPIVTANRNGGALLKNPDLLREIAASVQDACGEKACVSAKIRPGWKQADEMDGIREALARAGIRVVICHFRTVRERYEPVNDGLTRLASFTQAAQRSGMIVIGNGDVTNYADARAMREASGCDAVAVGRALLQDPGILQKIERGISDPPQFSEQREFFATLFRISLETDSPPKHARCSLLEAVRLASGVGSSLFRTLSAMSYPEMKAFFSQTPSENATLPP